MKQQHPLSASLSADSIGTLNLPASGPSNGPAGLTGIAFCPHDPAL
jgi:hypothetical protein